MMPSNETQGTENSKAAKAEDKLDFPELTRTGAMDFFSEYGRMIYYPQGIRYWTNKAKQSARIDATIGSAKGHEHTVFPEGGTREITLCSIPRC